MMGQLPCAYCGQGAKHRPLVCLAARLQSDGRSSNERRREDLAAACVRETGLSKVACREHVDILFAEITNGLVRDGVVSLDVFGVFEAAKKAERPSRNPNTSAAAGLSSDFARPSSFARPSISPHKHCFTSRRMTMQPQLDCLIARFAF